MRVTVRHTPFTAMLSPARMTSASRFPRSTYSVRPSGTGLMAEIRPVASMIPVNMSSVFPGSDVQGQAQIPADRAYIPKRQTPFVRQSFDSGYQEHFMGVTAKQIRRHVNDQFIHQPPGQHGAAQSRARFQHHLVDFTSPQFRKHRLRIDAASLHGAANHFHVLLGIKIRVSHDLRIRHDQYIARLRQDGGIHRCAQAAVKNDPQGLTPDAGQAGGHPGVVPQNGADARDDGRAGRPQPVRIPARGFRSDPLAFPVGHGCLAVKTRGDLQRDPGHSLGDPADKTAIQSERMLPVGAHIHVDAGLPEDCYAGAVHPRIRVLHGTDNPADSRLDDGIRAWRGPAMKAAGLQVGIQRSALGMPSRLTQRIDLRMGFSGKPVPALPHYDAVPGDHTAYPRVGMGSASPLRSQLKRPCHEPVIIPRGMIVGVGNLRPAFGLGADGLPEFPDTWKNGHGQCPPESVPGVDKQGQLHLIAVVAQGFPQPLHLVAEGIKVLEIAIDRCEPDIRDLIEFPQFLHDLPADLLGQDFTVTAVGDFPLQPIQGRGHDLTVHGPLFQRAVDTPSEFPLIEAFPTSVGLDDLGHLQHRLLHGGEPLSALLTLPASAHGIAAVTEPGVDNPGIGSGAIGAAHHPGRGVSRAGICLCTFLDHRHEVFPADTKRQHRGACNEDG